MVDKSNEILKVNKKLNKFSHIAVLKFKEEGEDENDSSEHTK